MSCTFFNADARPRRSTSSSLLFSFFPRRIEFLSSGEEKEEEEEDEEAEEAEEAEEEEEGEKLDKEEADEEGIRLFSRHSLTASLFFSIRAACFMYHFQC